jgi:hypothetical protein
MQQSYTRFFTPSEANEIIPDIRGVVGQIIRRINSAHHLAASAASSVGGLAPVTDFNLSALQVEINQRLQWITDSGVELKLLAPATVSFPALRCGQEVRLHWSEGDASVSWWSNGRFEEEERHLIKADPEGWWEWLH